MTHTAHTPGPWEATNDPYEDGRPYFTIGNDRSYSSGGLNFSGIMKPEDASLIAAAPDLLEALEAMIEMSLTVANDTHESNKTAFELARAAIAKARGQA